MDRIVRGFVNYADGKQDSCYFENTPENLASFIVKSAGDSKDVKIETLFGETVLETKGTGGILAGEAEYIEKAAPLVQSMKSGEIEAKEPEYLDVENAGGADYLDSQELVEKEIEEIAGEIEG